MRPLTWFAAHSGLAILAGALAAATAAPELRLVSAPDPALAGRASNLDTGRPDTYGLIDLFRRDLVRNETLLVSAQVGRPDLTIVDVAENDVSDDRRWAAFVAAAADAVSAPLLGIPTQANVRDVGRGITCRIVMPTDEPPAYRGALETVALGFAPSRPRLAVASWSSSSNVVQVVEPGDSGPV